MKRAVLSAMLTALGLAGCGPPREYYGISLVQPVPGAALDERQMSADRARNLLMIIAVQEDCYERTPEGFRPLEPSEGAGLRCAELLEEVEIRGNRLGLGSGPDGLDALWLTALATMAHSGDKNAQFELGVRFEEAIGIERDVDKACSLYANAANSSGGTIWVYSPPVGNGTVGRLMPFDEGPIMPGLPKASERLESAC